jgi:hypothetical protein
VPWRPTYSIDAIRPFINGWNERWQPFRCDGDIAIARRPQNNFSGLRLPS